MKEIVCIGWQELHERGARKVAVAELGSLGCTPQAISTRGTNGNCVAEFNDAAELFNNKLSSAVNALNNKFPDSKFIVINSSSGPVDQFGMNNFLHLIILLCKQLSMHVFQVSLLWMLLAALREAMDSVLLMEHHAPIETSICSTMDTISLSSSTNSLHSIHTTKSSLFFTTELIIHFKQHMDASISSINIL